ncbi:MAG: D-sedoheptulose 7-phosphate isomerase [Flavihumibacter sp.]
MEQTIRSIIRASIETKEKIVQDPAMISRMQEATEWTTAAFKNGNRVWFCGNGGSAADAQHLAAELSGRFYKNRLALPAEALHCNSSYLTAVANDFGYNEIYARLVEGIMPAGDILFGFSTSGNSPNIVSAFEMARKKGVRTIGFTGANGGRLCALSDLLFDVPSNDTPRIQESHIMIGHIICQLVEEAYFA